jgi:hypothetical protein
MIMKKYYIILLASLTLVSCLDENPKSQLPEDEAYTSASNLYINTVATLYNYIGGNSESQGLQGTYRGVYDYNTFTTDEAMLPTRGGDWYDGGFWQSLYLHTWTSSDKSLYNTWSYLYKVIVLCNQSLDLIEKYSSLLTNSQKVSYEAEVRAVRAMYYYYLQDMFGNVPLVTSTAVSLNDVAQNKRSEVFDFAFTELQVVAPYLPDEHSNYQGNYYGRVTRPVAYFLLAKLALNAEIYTDDHWTGTSHPSGKDIYFTVDGQKMNAWKTVETYCDKLSAEGYSLESDYTTNFAVHNENSKENIFTIPMDKNLYANQFQYLFRSRHYSHGSAIGMDAENGTCATLSTVKTYGYGTSDIDSRYAINFYSDTLYVDGSIVHLDNGQPLVYKPLEVKLDLSGTAYEKTAGARMSKYAIDRTAYSDGKLQDNDIVLFRYADVLLMKAEAKVRNGEDGSLELNEIRSRVNMPSRVSSLTNILDERLLELMWEGWRRQDLIRFGKFCKAYDLRPQLSSEKDNHTIVFPIPDRALELNTNLSQNPGY